MSSRMRLAKVDPKKIRIPTIRVTSVWDPDEYQVFKASLEADGMANPIICVKENNTFWLADGKHRLEEALLQGTPKVEVAYKEGSLVDAKLRNLYLNRLRGRTKISEEVQLIKSLKEDDGLSLDQLEKRTGMSREIIEQRISISKAHELVQQALDQESIGVGIAFQLSRLPNPEGQVALLTRFMAMIPRPTTDWVREIIDGALEYQRKTGEEPQEQKPIIPVKTLKCYLCDQDYQVKHLAGINVCRTCYGVTRDYVQQRLKDQQEEVSPKQVLSREVALAGKEREGGP